jgi:transcriptional regulator of acetoin/glycerol metabolism
MIVEPITVEEETVVPSPNASLLACLTAQILAGRLSVEDARLIVKRREYYRAQAALREALDGGTSARTLREITDAAIRRAISEAGGNLSVAARALGVGKTTLYRRMRRG